MLEKGIMWSSFKNLQGWRFHSPSRQTVPVSLCPVKIPHAATQKQLPLLSLHLTERFDLIFSAACRFWNILLDHFLAAFKLNNQSSFKLLCIRCWGSLRILVAGLFQFVVSFVLFMEKSQNWTQCPQYRLTNAKQRGISTSFSLLAVCLLVHSSRHYYCMDALVTCVQLAAYQNAQVPFCKAVMQSVGSQPIVVCGFSCVFHDPS